MKWNEVHLHFSKFMYMKIKWCPFTFQQISLHDSPTNTSPYTDAHRYTDCKQLCNSTVVVFKRGTVCRMTYKHKYNNNRQHDSIIDIYCQFLMSFVGLLLFFCLVFFCLWLKAHSRGDWIFFFLNFPFLSLFLRFYIFCILFLDFPWEKHNCLL